MKTLHVIGCVTLTLLALPIYAVAASVLGVGCDL